MSKSWMIVILMAWMLIPLAVQAGHQMQPYHPVKNAIAYESREAGYPLAVLYALWIQECSKKPVCKRGKDGEYAAFQITAGAAKSARCQKGWKYGVYNVKCAMKIIKTNVAKCGSIAQAFEKYNSGKCGDRENLSRYAMETYILYLELLLEPKITLAKR